MYQKHRTASGTTNIAPNCLLSHVSIVLITHIINVHSHIPCSQTLFSHLKYEGSRLEWKPTPRVKQGCRVFRDTSRNVGRRREKGVTWCIYVIRDFRIKAGKSHRTYFCPLFDLYPNQPSHKLAIPNSPTSHAMGGAKSWSTGSWVCGLASTVCNKEGDIRLIWDLKRDLKESVCVSICQRLSAILFPLSTPVTFTFKVGCSSSIFAGF